MPRKIISLPREQTPVDYFFMVPNSIMDLGLEPRTIAVYCYLKKVAGEVGEFWQTTEQIAQHCKIRKATVVHVKKELEYLGLIEIHINPQGRSHRHYIQIVDIWKANHDHYCPGEVAVPETEGRGSHGGTRVEDGGSHSLLTKKTPLNKKDPIKNTPSVGTLPIDESLLDLPGWDNSIESTVDWKSRFILDFPAFTIQDVKACRDFHGEDTDGNRMTGRWKVRLRQWMLHKRPGKETNGTRPGSTGRYPGQDREASGEALKASVNKPLR